MFRSSGISTKYVSSNAGFPCGPWMVQDAVEKSTSNKVSIFTFDKKRLESILLKDFTKLQVKETINEIIKRLKSDVALITRLRHPSILEIIEPLEESKSCLIFVTERVISCLTSIIDPLLQRKLSGNILNNNLKIDELEIRKGLLLITRGLEFLHNSAFLVHLNLQPQSIIINSKSDWKLAGFGFATSFHDYNNKEYFIPNINHYMPRSVQLDLDYCAPELVLQRQLNPQNDIFSLGCLIISLYTNHSPINSHQSISEYNSIIKSFNIPNDSRIPKYLLQILPNLLSKSPSTRYSSTTFLNSSYFDNILISTIRFLDALPTKSFQERQAFFRGFPNVRSQFPIPILQRKILPYFIDELGKSNDLDALVLTNILSIGKTLSQLSFTERILPSIKKLININLKQNKISPSSSSSTQLLVALLDNVDIIESKLSAKDFKSYIFPAILKSMNSDDSFLVEKALNIVPNILPGLDFVTVKNDLFPQVRTVFAKTSSLSVKVAALKSFQGLITGGLDKHTITQNLLPVLKLIKTRDPQVMMATLNVYSSLINMVDINILASEILPQLWIFSITSHLNLSQFEKFVDTINKMSTKIIEIQRNKLQNIDTSNAISSSNANSSSSRLASHGSVETEHLSDNFEKLVLGKDIKNSDATIDLNPTPLDPSNSHLNIQSSNSSALDNDLNLPWGSQNSNNDFSNPSTNSQPKLTPLSLNKQTPLSKLNISLSSSTLSPKPASTNSPSTHQFKNPTSSQSGAIDWSKASTPDPTTSYFSTNSSYNNLTPLSFGQTTSKPLTPTNNYNNNNNNTLNTFPVLSPKSNNDSFNNDDSFGPFTGAPSQPTSSNPTEGLSKYTSLL